MLVALAFGNNLEEALMKRLSRVFLILMISLFAIAGVFANGGQEAEKDAPVFVMEIGRAHV